MCVDVYRQQRNQLNHEVDLITTSDYVELPSCHTPVPYPSTSSTKSTFNGVDSMCEAAVLTRRGSLETREADLKQIFDLCDRDRRGYLDRDEFRELGRKFFGGSEEVGCVSQASMHLSKPCSVS